MYQQIFQVLTGTIMKMAVFWNAAPCTWKFTDVSVALTASITRAMNSHDEGSKDLRNVVNFNRTTRRNIPVVM
jgi:hypothetical protein